MLKLILRRILLLIPIVIGVSIFIFLLMRAIPGDPALLIAGEDATPEVLEQIREEYHLNDPLLVQ